MSRATIAILSTANLLHNIGVARKQAPNSKIIAMVKANAYGHGIRSVSLKIANHVDILGVASIDEALILRKVGVKSPIMLMQGVFQPEEIILASCEGLQVVFHTAEQLQWLDKTYVPIPITSWLKVDTGMGRLGFSADQALNFYQKLSGSKKISQPVGLISHLACADDYESKINTDQITSFQKITSAIGRSGFPKSLANSAAIFNFPDIQYEYVRPGIILYGVSPLANKTAIDLNLRPVMTLYTQLIAVKFLRKGDRIGYGGSFVCPENMPVGTIAIGYGDGYPRTTCIGAPVLVEGVRCQVIGNVSMDMTTIDLRPCSGAEVGSGVVLWGENLAIEEVASHTSRIPFDLLTSVQNRVRFHWTL